MVLVEVANGGGGANIPGKPASPRACGGASGAGEGAPGSPPGGEDSAQPPPLNKQKRTARTAEEAAALAERTARAQPHQCPWCGKMRVAKKGKPQETRR